jgi:arginyl-tRNA synthetase
MKFKISPEIFARWPQARIGVMVVTGLDNRKGTAVDREILALLRRQEEKTPSLVGETPIGQLAKVASWRQVYRDFGVKGNEFRSSVEALLRRAKSGKRLPDINPLVNLYNFLSLKYQLPFGGEDLDRIEGDIALKVCDGSERGTYIGGKEEVACERGEVAYCDEKGFICRRWNWREAERTKLEAETRAAVLVVEAMPPVGEPELRLILEELAEFLMDRMKGEIHGAILSREKTEMEINYTPQGREPLAAKKRAGREIKKAGKAGKKAVVSKLPALLQKEVLTRVEKEVLTEVKKAVKKAGFDEGKVKISHPTEERFGDFTSNLAMIVHAQIQNSKGKREDLESPLAIAKLLKSQISNLKSQTIEKVEVVEPGFINLWLKDEVFLAELRRVIKEKEKYGTSDFLKDKRILLEHTSPDPIKTIHIGHLRNNFLGMAVGRVLKSLGALVILDSINNDRGTHVSRAMFGYLVFGRKESGLAEDDLLNFRVSDEEVRRLTQAADWKDLLDEWLTTPDGWWGPEDWGLKPDHQNLVFYSLGDRAERLVPEIKEQVRQILRAWEEEKPKVRALWRQIIDWSLSGYRVTYERIGSQHDKVWHESELYQLGKRLVENGLEKGVFKKSQGAVVTDLAKFGLPDTVVVKSDGTSLYHTFDINLVLQKKRAFPSNLFIWDVGNDQLLYLRQLFAICEQLGIGKREEFFHLNYGYVSLKSGEKMSSRRGTVVKADELLDLLRGKVEKIMDQVSRPKVEDSARPKKEDGEEVAEKVALAAIKYGLLRTYRVNDIQFDPEASVSLKGDSGPYLQYAYARCQSVLKKALAQKVVFSLSEYDLFKGKLVGLGRSQRGGAMSGFGRPWSSPTGAMSDFGRGPVASAGAGKPKADFLKSVSSEEKALWRTIYRYEEVVLEAGQRLAPDLVCHFLLGLAQKFNLFYDRHSILGLEKTENQESKVIKDNKGDQKKLDPDLKSLRLILTAATAQVLKNGLELLGIEPLERM